jgi:dihydrofolate reductase
MARIRYQVACSLDGFIAGPNGEFDWIIMDPAIDFDALAAQFDLLVMGRKTYEVMLETGGDFYGKKVLVFSNSLRGSDVPDVTIVAGDPRTHLEPLRAGSGKDIWLFGGGELFRSCLDAGLVDTVEPAIIPIILGEGVPFLATPAARCSLKLERHHVYPTGIVLLEYAVLP